MKSITDLDSEFVCEINAPCFELLNADELRLIRASRTQVRYRRGEMMAKQGAFASYILFVVSGLAKVYIEGEDGRNIALWLACPGDFIGISAVFNSNIFDYSLTALADTQVYLIEKETIASLSQNNGRFAYYLMRRYASQNTDLYRSIGQLMFKQMHGRLAGILLQLSQASPLGMDIFPLLQRRDLADFAGLSVESTVKLLKIFEKDGLIVLSDKQIDILDRKGLEIIAQKG